MISDIPVNLANRNFILLCCCNLFFCMSMYMTLPVLPLYLTQELGCDTGITGLVVAIYSIAALVSRPFSGYIVDSFQRKHVYFIFMLAFVVAGAGYIFIVNILLLSIVRTGHGVAFSVTGTAINTFAIDFMPQNKVGTGIGVFGMLSSVAMALGPMIGMFFNELFSYTGVFILNTATSLLAFMCGALVNYKHRTLPPRKMPAISSLILKRALIPAAGFIMAGYSYGMISNYVSLMAVERNINVNTGVFFMFMALGMFCARLFAGKLADKGLVLPVIFTSKLILIGSFVLFLLFSSPAAFFASALFMGVGFGMFSPAYQTLFISLADKGKIGTANSTYYISWDIGISVAIFTGGYIAHFVNLAATFWFSVTLLVMSLLFFTFITCRKYKEYRAGM